VNGAIYVDFDDVLCETARTLADIVADRFGRRTRFEDIYSFDLNVSFGLTPPEQEVLFSLFHDEDVLAGIPAVEGAAAALRSWTAAGCAVHVVTGRPPETRDASFAWLDAHGIEVEDITFVDKYNRGHAAVPGVRQMTLADLESCAFSLVVDDSADMVRFFAQRTRVPVVLFDRPWNAAMGNEAMRDDVVRCRGWSELVERFPRPGNPSRRDMA